MKIKKILGTVISAAMCLSMIAFNTSAVSDNEDVINAAPNTTFDVSECVFDYGDIDLSSSKIEKLAAIFLKSLHMQTAKAGAIV